MSSDVIIKAKHLAKAYKLYDTPGFKPLRDWIASQPAVQLVK